jgi:1-deoxy-D-xylulose-5-phosphate reductoisomerase
LGKRIAILGSTGSIGCNALEVIGNLGPSFHAVALSAHNQTSRLAEQVRQHRPAAVALTQARPDPALVSELRSLGSEVYTGPEGMEQLVRRDDVDLVLAAVVGAAGLPAVLAAVRAGKSLALANKESLVVAGSLLIPEAKRQGVRILPVDSEHSAIFQAMHCGRLNEVRRVVLTASGGPFRNTPRNVMENATVQDALKHPTWRMGNKVTIDSASMFNKALELLEACWLFDLPPEKVEVVVHPESIIHSMVEFVDGSVIAQLSPPDMRTPIQYALTYPERAPGIGRRLEMGKPFALHFEPPDPGRFPALRLAYDVARTGGTAGAVLNGANEAAVSAFMGGAIAFGEISRVVELTIARHRAGPVGTAGGIVAEPSLEQLLAADAAARETARGLMAESSKSLVRK